MSKMIDVNFDPFASETKAGENKVAKGSDYYVDDEFFRIDPVAADRYNTLISELSQYSPYAEDVQDLRDEQQRIRVFAALSYALRKAGEAEAWAGFVYNTSRQGSKESEAVAALDEFGAYAKAKTDGGSEVKNTDKNREWFVQQSPSVVQNKKREAMAEAMQKVFFIYRYQFSQAISTIRAMVYGNRDSSTLSSFDHK